MAMLKDRNQQILDTIIEHYIQTAEPVGSRSLSKLAKLGLSAATIRNVMSDLTEAGFLSQPHTSAGRIPTDLAYRHYVDQVQRLRSAAEPTAEQEDESDSQIGIQYQRLEDVLQAAADQLTKYTHCTGVLLAPRPTPSVLKKIELIAISQTQVLVVLVTEAGMVSHRIIAFRECPTQEGLNRIASILRTLFLGKVIGDIHERLIETLADEAQELSAHAIRIGKRAFAVERLGSLYLSGSANLCEYPEFKDSECLGKVYRQFEDKESLTTLFENMSQTEGLHIQIGSENQGYGLESCAIFATPYGSKGKLLGCIGVVAPTRIDYPKVMDAISRTSRQLSYAVNHFLTPS